MLYSGHVLHAKYSTARVWCYSWHATVRGSIHFFVVLQQRRPKDTMRELSNHTLGYRELISGQLVVLIAVS